MRDMQQLITRLPQWTDGLLSDGEILGYALNAMSDVYAVMMDIQKSVIKAETDRAEEGGMCFLFTLGSHETHGPFETHKRAHAFAKRREITSYTLLPFRLPFKV